MKKDLNLTICKVILSICYERELSPTELEKASGLQKDTLRNIIRGKSKNPKFDTIATIAKALHISIDNLIFSDNQAIKHTLWDPFLLVEIIQNLEDIRKDLDISLDFNDAINILSKSYIEYINGSKNESIKHYISSNLLGRQNI